MKRYKTVLNIVAGAFVLVFIAWMFSFATPEKPKTWKPKYSMKYATKVKEFKPINEVKSLEEILFPPKQ
jgi:hypothetical protein